MKKILVIFILGLISINARAQCDGYDSDMSSVVSDADGAWHAAERTYQIALKVYNCSSLEYARSSAKLAMDEAEKAVRYAGDAASFASSANRIAYCCDCYEGLFHSSNAEDEAEATRKAAKWAYHYARKTLDSDSLKEAHFYAKEIITAAKNAKREAGYASDSGSRGQWFCD